MQSFLFTNTFFEEELVSITPLTPLDFLQKHSLYFQLQYLSCLVATPSETPLLSEPPSLEYLSQLKNLGLPVQSFALLSDDPVGSSSLSSWGPSLSLQKWALERNCSYNIPSLDVVKKVQSKEFSFLYSPQLEGSKIIQNQEELILWWESVKGPKVLKTLYGSSGRGHFISYDDLLDLPKALAFLKRNEKDSSLLIAQPWVERVLDFSTQWTIQENGEFSYLGATLCENSSKGIYSKSVVGKESLLFKDHIDFFQEHLSFAKKAIEKLKSLHFFGNVGFDAMIYKHPNSGQIRLLPIVEINARKTMGWVALRLYQKLSCDSLLSISYQPSSKASFGLLPSHHNSKPFSKQLTLEISKK